MARGTPQDGQQYSPGLAGIPEEWPQLLHWIEYLADTERIARKSIVKAPTKPKSNRKTPMVIVISDQPCASIFKTKKANGHWPINIVSLILPYKQIVYLITHISPKIAKNIN